MSTRQDLTFGAGLWMFGQFVDRYATDCYGPSVGVYVGPRYGYYGYYPSYGYGYRPYAYYPYWRGRHFYRRHYGWY